MGRDSDSERDRRSSRSSSHNSRRFSQDRYEKRSSKPRSQRSDADRDVRKSVTKQERKEKKALPFRRTYYIELPFFLSDKLLQQNGVKGTSKDYQLQIVLDKEK